MSDSGDMFGDKPAGEGDRVEDPAPGAAELEAAGQSALFGVTDQPVPNAPENDAPENGRPGNDGPGNEGPAPALEKRSVPPVAAPAQPYRVLARKYRPQTFSELIGQEPMVRTLANAIERDRLAHAFLMTGVRGVGKTSTARLIAKALNCIGPDGKGGPTIDPCGQCEPCLAIAEGRHIDVIEMDAASHTGVDDVREIIEAVRYSAVSARYKIYIIDEVHMLSRNAFNALLKTLEEPPAHVKFLFATTEVDKLPVTVLSRTQRFDLRRIPADMLARHFASICRQEGVAAEDEAIAIIASAAEGSVRDGLSILDQAIAHADMEHSADSEGEQALVTAERVRDMLGLADRGAQRRLFGSLLEGDPQGLLQAIDHQYALGVEPLALMRAMMELTHRIAISQVGKAQADAPTQEEREAIGEWSGRLTPGQVHRLWQLLMKGHDEVRGAPDPLAAAQMALLRVLHAADMPDPGKLAQSLGQGQAGSVGAGQGASQAGAGDGLPGAGEISAPLAGPRWEELVARIEEAGNLHLANRLRMQVGVIEIAADRLVYAQHERFGEDLRPELRAALLAVTDRHWTVEKGDPERARPTIVEEELAAQEAERASIRNHALVAAALEVFPEAEFVEDDERPGTQWNKSR